MLREILSGFRGFTENAAFVGGAVITWLADPQSTAAGREPWWYGLIVFVAFALTSAALTALIVAAERADEARRAADEAARTKLLLKLEGDIKLLADKLDKAQPAQSATVGAAVLPGAAPPTASPGKVV